MIGWLAARVGTSALLYALLAGATALSIAGLVLGIRRSGRLAERAEALAKNEEIRRAQLDAAAARPRDRAALADRMLNGRF